MYISNYALQPFKAYCAIWVRRSNFRHQASPRMSPRESTQRRKVELCARNVREFCLNADFHVTFRDLFLRKTYSPKVVGVYSLRETLVIIQKSSRYTNVGCVFVLVHVGTSC